MISVRLVQKAKPVGPTFCASEISVVTLITRYMEGVRGIERGTQCAILH